MSHHSQASQVKPSTTHLNLETINELADKLQEVAEALLALGHEDPPEPDDETDEETPGPRPPKEPDQIRCYRVPAFIAKIEQKTLKEYKAENLLDFLQKAREEIFITAFLLRNFADYEDVTGYTLNQIGEHFERPLAMLNRLCSIVADYKPHPLEPELTA